MNKSELAPVFVCVFLFFFFSISSKDDVGGITNAGKSHRNRNLPFRLEVVGFDKNCPLGEGRAKC